MTIDLATLTGAARVALGPDLPPFYTDDEALAGRDRGGVARRPRSAVADAPMGAPTTVALDSDVAELKNDADAWAQAGSITAALFLKRFAPPHRRLGRIWTSSPGTRATAPAIPSAARRRRSAPSIQMLRSRYPAKADPAMASE